MEVLTVGGSGLAAVWEVWGVGVWMKNIYPQGTKESGPKGEAREGPVSAPLSFAQTVVHNMAPAHLEQGVNSSFYKFLQRDGRCLTNIEQEAHPPPGEDHWPGARRRDVVAARSYSGFSQKNYGADYRPRPHRYLSPRGVENAVLDDDGDRW